MAEIYQIFGWHFGKSKRHSKINWPLVYWFLVVCVSLFTENMWFQEKIAVYFGWNFFLHFCFFFESERNMSFHILPSSHQISLKLSCLSVPLVLAITSKKYIVVKCRICWSESTLQLFQKINWVFYSIQILYNSY